MNESQLVPNRIVIKVGGDTLAYADGTLNTKAFASIARQVAVLRTQGKQVAIVTSAGIKAGIQTLKSLGIESASVSKKLLAGIGAELLLSTWATAFRPYKIAIAQFWVTHGNWDKDGERERIESGLLEALGLGIVPIVNENDVVSDNEIVLMDKGWGENDNMAARIASLVHAFSVLFLSSVGGIYEANPRQHSSARRYDEINAHDIPQSLRSQNGTSPHGDGKDGINNIRTKIDAAAFCCRLGMRVNIASLSADSNMIILFGSAGENYGTRMGTENILKG
ncbi:MAG: Glutamate 5-kinase [Parcubacteria group bacterium GW2011_GWA2_47_16]|nr:MAG: Glutamate 5-kinase [Parcubacteria group bacterium GW2011_GWA2_47_16]